MDLVARHLRTHLIGLSAAIQLFGRGAHLRDARSRTVVSRMREELRHEQRAVRRIARDLDLHGVIVPSLVTRVGERLQRLGPSRRSIVRTPLCDVIDLEAMRDAVVAKVAGWEALLTCERLDREVIARLLEQARLQHATLCELHLAAAQHAFADQRCGAS